MKKYALLLLALAVIDAGALAGGSGWQTDFEKALKKAAKSERPMLVEFTDGEASKEINKGLFYTPKFKAWAKRRVVLVELNYGKRVSPKLAEQYEKLKTKYKVEQFPTLLLISHEGKSLGALPAFRKGAEKAWLAEAGEILEAASGAGKWLTDYAAAKKISKRTRKPMLLDFNGSDW
jgi:thioredoxin-related protein